MSPTTAVKFHKETKAKLNAVCSSSFSFSISPLFKGLTFSLLLLSEKNYFFQILSVSNNTEPDNDSFSLVPKNTSLHWCSALGQLHRQH